MKKALLLLVLILTLSCSNDDSKEAKVIDQHECYMKVLLISEGKENNIPIYQMHYGTSVNDRVELVVSENVFKFYKNRMSSNNDHWIGEVDKINNINELKGQDQQECFMKVLLISEGKENNVPIYQMHYGTSTNDRVELVVSEKVFQFYKNRMSSNNNHWIGEVDHE